LISTTLFQVKEVGEVVGASENLRWQDLGSLPAVTGHSGGERDKHKTEVKVGSENGE